jgi:hypothetical protein
MNVLAKLKHRQHELDGLVLHTTLQPCVQCLGAIRLSPIRRVRVLAPDPIFLGIERIREVNTFMAANWPVIDQLPITEWSVLSLLFPTHTQVFWESQLDLWSQRLPQITALAERLVASGLLVDHVAAGSDVVTFASALWPQLSDGIDEVQSLADAHD